MKLYRVNYLYLSEHITISEVEVVKEDEEFYYVPGTFRDRLVKVSKKTMETGLDFYLYGRSEKDVIEVIKSKCSGRISSNNKKIERLRFNIRDLQEDNTVHHKIIESANAYKFGDVVE